MAFLSVFIPAFNEEQNLAYKVAALSERLATLVPSHERLIVDDASRDHPRALADELARPCTSSYAQSGHRARIY